MEHWFKLTAALYRMISFVYQTVLDGLGLKWNRKKIDSKTWNA